MESEKRLYRYPKCKIIAGYSRYLIQDFSSGKYFFIPQLLSDILQNCNGKTIEEILCYSNKANPYLSSYIIFLQEHNLAYFSEVELCFREFSLEFDYPAVISNVIIILKKISYLHIIEQLPAIAQLGCESIQLFLYDDFFIEELQFILNFLKQSRISTIDVIMNHCKRNNVKDLKQLLLYEPKLSKLMIYNAPIRKNIKIHKHSPKCIIYTDIDLSYSNECGFIHPFLFKNNIFFFAEAQAHNACLNRKLCIDAEGNIKNCPAMAHSFGNIKDTTLQEAIEKERFKDLWFINKDKIDVCKDCEFRYMCMDCRCFIKDPENIYSQPAKCGYNPYICKWEGQEGYIPVEECGIYSRENGFVPNPEKIKELNKQIWGEDDE